MKEKKITDKIISPDSFFIEKMQMSEIREVADILTDAFETNPAYSIIFDKANNPKDGLLWLFKANLFLLNRRQILKNVIKEKHSKSLIGTYTLIPPMGAKKTITDHLQIGLPQFILKFGFHTLYKMLGLDSYNKKILDESMKTAKY
ncbi:MAG: hypothetical protein LBT27_01895, partial [Prevotellaceae bacterium]|nr:hypothetical protein [Prevotellaceae bacterium]